MAWNVEREMLFGMVTALRTAMKDQQVAIAELTGLCEMASAAIEEIVESGLVDKVDIERLRSQLKDTESKRQWWKDRAVAIATRLSGWKRRTKNRTAEAQAYREEMIKARIALSEMAREQNCPISYRRIDGRGPTYAIYGTSSIAYADALLRLLERARADQARDAGAPTEGASTELVENNGAPRR